MARIDLEQLEKRISEALEGAPGGNDVLLERDLERGIFLLWREVPGGVECIELDEDFIRKGDFSGLAEEIPRAGPILPARCSPHDRFSWETVTARSMVLQALGPEGEQVLSRRLKTARSTAGIEPGRTMTLREHRRYWQLFELEAAALLKEHVASIPDMRHKSDLEPRGTSERITRAIKGHMPEAVVGSIAINRGRHHEDISVQMRVPRAAPGCSPADYAKVGILAGPPAYAISDELERKLQRQIVGADDPRVRQAMRDDVKEVVIPLPATTYSDAARKVVEAMVAVATKHMLEGVKAKSSDAISDEEFWRRAGLPGPVPTKRLNGGKA